MLHSPDTQGIVLGRGEGLQFTPTKISVGKGTSDPTERMVPHLLISF